MARIPPTSLEIKALLAYGKAFDAVREMSTRICYIRKALHTGDVAEARRLADIETANEANPMAYYAIKGASDE